ncbi:MAG: hypothetical protein E6R04_03125 [Spirochaetes bacterium]|nr:MAG: hypothetical protein E6R04_03125 [Spirochaetota bacterium]
MIRRAYSRVRYAVSSLRRHRSLTPVLHARETLRNFTELCAEVDAAHSSAVAIAATPILFDTRFMDMQEFRRDTSTAQRAVTATDSSRELEAMDVAVLRATLSWRVACESARIKTRRGVLPDGTSLNIANQDLLHEAIQVSERGASRTEVVQLIRRAGFAVE